MHKSPIRSILEGICTEGTFCRKSAGKGLKAQVSNRKLMQESIKNTCEVGYPRLTLPPLAKGKDKHLQVGKKVNRKLRVENLKVKSQSTQQLNQLKSKNF